MFEEAKRGDHDCDHGGKGREIQARHAARERRDANSEGSENAECAEKEFACPSGRRGARGVPHRTDAYVPVKGTEEGLFEAIEHKASRGVSVGFAELCLLIRQAAMESSLRPVTDTFPNDIFVRRWTKKTFNISFRKAKRLEGKRGEAFTAVYYEVSRLDPRQRLNIKFLAGCGAPDSRVLTLDTGSCTPKRFICSAKPHYLNDKAQVPSAELCLHTKSLIPRPCLLDLDSPAPVC